MTLPAIGEGNVEAGLKGLLTKKILVAMYISSGCKCVLGALSIGKRRNIASYSTSLPRSVHGRARCCSLALFTRSVPCAGPGMADVLRSFPCSNCRQEWESLEAGHNTGRVEAA